MYTIASAVKKHRLYRDFDQVQARLNRHGFVCWIVGGAVRDFYLGREVNEFDLVTDACTENLKVLFPEAVLVGESFGVLKIPLKCGEFFDLSTFRQESDYVDGRRPSQVESATPVKDSVRRDFTINALYWDDKNQTLWDYQSGLQDLQNHILKCVGLAEVRFAEDHLRIMRALRFAAQMNLDIEESTLAAALKAKDKIEKISGERIWSEFKKIKELSSWKFVLQQKLFAELAHIIFGVDDLRLNFLQNLDTLKDERLVFWIVYELSPETDFSMLLKKKLKLSNQELQTYQSLQFILHNYQRMEFAEFCYEVEKSKKHLESLEFLVEAKKISPSFVEGVKKKLKTSENFPLSTSEMLELIPARRISEELKFLRISYLNESYKTKADMVEYLKKKYAGKSEKT